MTFHICAWINENDRPQTCSFTGVWCLLLFLRFGFTHEIKQTLWGAVLAIDGALLIFGATVAWLHVAAIRRTRSRLQAFGLASVLFLGGIAYGSNVLEDTGTHFRFLRLKSEYAGIVEQLEAGTIETRGVCDGISYQSEAGPELRIAFGWGGLIDNWYGVVYDPTGLVIRSNEFLSDWPNWQAPDLAQVKGLFGGDLRRAQHLGGHWFLWGANFGLRNRMNIEIDRY